MNRKPTLLQNFQDRISEVIDEYLLLGADPDKLRDVLQQELSSNMESRAKELGHERTLGE